MMDMDIQVIQVIQDLEDIKDLQVAQEVMVQTHYVYNVL